MKKLIQVDSSRSHVCLKTKNEIEYVFNIDNINLMKDAAAACCFISFPSGIEKIEISEAVYKELKEFLMS